MEIAGKDALVTGGASGLGLATVQALTERGARVVTLDLPSSDGERVAQELEGGVSFVSGDVRSEADVERALEAAGDLRILVNCAGIGPGARIVGREGPMPLAEFQRVIDINLVGTFNVLRLAAHRMAQLEPANDERGVIINTASVAAYEGQVGQAAYSASKGGIVALTITAARDLADHLIRVCTIAPGTFDTPLLARPRRALPARSGAGDPPPQAIRAAPGVRRSGLPRHRQPDAERRDDPAGRCPPDGSPLDRDLQATGDPRGSRRLIGTPGDPPVLLRATSGSAASWQRTKRSAVRSQHRTAAT